MLSNKFSYSMTAHGHMLQKTIGLDGSVILVAYLSFPNECEFVVMKMHDPVGGFIKFSHICRIFGPQVIFTHDIEIATSLSRF